MDEQHLKVDAQFGGEDQAKILDFSKKVVLTETKSVLEFLGEENDKTSFVMEDNQNKLFEYSKMIFLIQSMQI